MALIASSSASLKMSVDVSRIYINIYIYVMMYNLFLASLEVA